MKRKLFLGLSVLSAICLASCGPTAEEGAENEDARLLKKAGTQLIEISRDKQQQQSSAVRLAWQPASADSLQFELKQPGIYFYLAGAMLTNVNYDIAKPISFNGEFTYDYQPGNSIYMDMTMDMTAKLDRDNNKMTFGGSLHMLQGPSKEETQEYTSPLFYEIGFDFASETVQSFKYWQVASPGTTIIVFEYDKPTDSGRYYYVQENDETEDGTTLRNEFTTRKSAFDAAMANAVKAEGEMNKKCCLTFVETQNYVDSIFGQNLNMTYLGE